VLSIDRSSQQTETTNALGDEIPGRPLALADEVIE
jgi:hypothetical protein